MNSTATRQLPLHPPVAEVSKYASSTPDSKYSGIKLSTVKELLNDTCRELGVSLYHLSSLLGISEPASIYRWINGSRSPNGMAMLRIYQLLEWKRQGYDVKSYRSVFWDSGLVMIRGTNENRSKVAFINGGLSQNKGRGQSAMAPNAAAQDGQSQDGSYPDSQLHRQSNKDKASRLVDPQNNGGPGGVDKPIASFGGMRS